MKRKAAGHTIEPSPEPERSSNVVSLMDALRESMGAGRKGGRQNRTRSQSVSAQRGKSAKTGPKRKKSSGRRRKAA